MAVVMRPYHDVVAPDLQKEYDKTDELVHRRFKQGARLLRDLSQISYLARHPDFDPMRYAALQRTALALASDLERAIANSGLAK